MDIYIYGAGKNGHIIYDLLKNNYDEIAIKTFIDSRKEGYINGIPIIKVNDIYDKKIRVLISIFDFKEALKVFSILKEKGFKDIWWFNVPQRIFKKDFFEEQCISCVGWDENMLEHVEMHVMDACNLNCKGCSHFSPIFEKEIPKFEDRIEDIRKLIKKDIRIAEFYLLGGEPFLNPEIDKYVIECRKILPYSEISIVTNGLLIPSIENRVFELIKENRVKISISEYNPTHKMIERICAKLDSFSIIYNVRSFDTKDKFNKPLTIDSNKKLNKCCISNGCINIWKGKIARCPSLMYIDKFNETFNTNLPNNGIMDLDNCPSGLQLVEELEKKVPLCNHCVENSIEWEICGKNVCLEDFAI